MTSRTGKSRILVASAGHWRRTAAFLLAGLAGGWAQANSFGENAAWQFPTPSDRVNAAAVQDMVQKKKAGQYAAPISNYSYTTRIERQYNCDVNAAATGNQGSNSAVANAPSSSGAAADATGNANDSNVGALGATQIGSTQSNTGWVGSNAMGDSTSFAAGSPRQTLSSVQTNSGHQSASINGSTACAFGSLN